MKKQRPVYLNLLQIKLPASGVVSILHRFSGLMLFLMIPLLLLLLEASLASEERFQQLSVGNASVIFRLIIFLGTWAIMHHLLAGIRFLLLDLHKGIALAQARTSARLVLAGSFLSALMAGWWLW
jgi:succinate dehydrogenase / fumarate reductase cytochrome b subunit